MTFSYDAGSSSPNLAGLVEIGSIRINDGTFELQSAIGLLWGSPGLRDSFFVLPNDHGAVAAAPFYSEREIVLNGEIVVPTVADLWGAIDLLNETFNLADSDLKTLTVNTSGWSASRQCDVRIAGEIDIPEPSDKNSHLSTRRRFSVPLAAPDPRLYSTTEHSQTITTGTSVINAGKMPCPIKVRFNGPQTDPDIDLTGTSGSDRIRFAGTIPSGHYVEVAAFAASATGVYAVDDTGVNAMGLDSAYGGPVTAFTARSIPSGSSSWTASNTSGSGTTVLYWRDAW